MAAERLPMRKIREILRLRWVLKYGVRQTALSELEAVLLRPWAGAGLGRARMPPRIAFQEVEGAGCNGLTRDRLTLRHQRVEIAVDEARIEAPGAELLRLA